MKYLGLFLSDENIRYEIKNAKGIEPINEEENDRIINRYSKNFNDIRFNIVLFNLKYPKKRMCDK